MQKANAQTLPTSIPAAQPAIFQPSPQSTPRAANAVTAFVFCLGAAMFYVLLYRSRIAPRWISAWGLVAIPFYVAAYLLPLYGVFDVDTPAQVLLYTPLAVQEMVLAVWMIARGFRPAALSIPSGRRFSRRSVEARARLTVGGSG